MRHVSEFMVHVEKVVKCTEWDPIEKIVEQIMDKEISCVIVMEEDGSKPKGIVTKTDIVAAYMQKIPPHQKVGVIMDRDLKFVRDIAPRDRAAKVFEHTRKHHAIVLDEDGKFVGLISTWDIAADCGRGACAWPWPKAAEDGYIDTATGVH